ncbi:MAG: hypothetical protein BMS9Abin02_0418 [Anaerolineae bacterium]|nr:MAG: hypothetical protein BMS9Abin02_0418 [Anaerolineae bacterium]
MRRRPLFAIVIVLGIGLLAFFLIGFVRDYVAPWVLATIWRAYLMTDSIPQVMIWAVFVSAIPILAIFVLIQDKSKFVEDKQPDGHTKSGLVVKWSKLIKRSGSGDYFKRRFVRELADLTIATIRYRERISEDEAKKALRSGQLPLEPGIYDYLAQGWRREYFSTSDRKARSGRFLGLFKTPASATTSTRWKDPNMDKVVEFLEEELEVESGS